MPVVRPSLILPEIVPGFARGRETRLLKAKKAITRPSGELIRGGFWFILPTCALTVPIFNFEIST